MTRAELLEAASERLSGAIVLLTAAGEDCLAFEVEAIADRVDVGTVPLTVTTRAGASDADGELLRLMQLALVLSSVHLRHCASTWAQARRSQF